MTTEERRAQLYALLAQAQQPLTGSALARRFGVSRQIIVGDIGILRAEGTAILATPRGYLLPRRERRGVMATLACCHTAARMGEELDIIVDGGATITLGGATDGNCEIGKVTIASPPKNRMSSEMTIASAGRKRIFSNMPRTPIPLCTSES